MNARNTLNVAVSMVLGTALAVAAGCAKSDNPPDTAATDTASAAPASDAANPAATGADTAQSPGSMALHRVMEEGEAMPMTISGDVDKDFASMMTMHHQTAIKMVDVFQEHGQSAELKAMAAKTKADQQEEIKKMAPHASAAGATGAAATGHEGMAGMDHGNGAATAAAGGDGAAALHRIMEESKAMPMTMSGDVDKDFAMMMTMHHQDAIKMIDVLQQNGKAADLKALGAKMKAKQQEEIQKLQAFAG